MQYLIGFFNKLTCRDRKLRLRTGAVTSQGHTARPAWSSVAPTLTPNPTPSSGNPTARSTPAAPDRVSEILSPTVLWVQPGSTRHCPCAAGRFHTVLGRTRGEAASDAAAPPAGLQTLCSQPASQPALGRVTGKGFLRAGSDRGWSDSEPPKARGRCNNRGTLSRIAGCVSRWCIPLGQTLGLDRVTTCPRSHETSLVWDPDLLWKLPRSLNLLESRAPRTGILGFREEPGTMLGSRLRSCPVRTDLWVTLGRTSPQPGGISAEEALTSKGPSAPSREQCSALRKRLT